jgi:hypothetical protein
MVMVLRALVGVTVPVVADVVPQTKDAAHWNRFAPFFFFDMLGQKIHKHGAR